MMRFLHGFIAAALLQLDHNGASAYQVAQLATIAPVSEKPPFPWIDLLLWVADIDASVVDGFRDQVYRFTDAVSTVKKSVEDVRKKMEEVRPLIDPATWEQWGSIAKGIKSIATGGSKHNSTKPQEPKRKKAKHMPQTPEERNREPRTRERLYSTIKHFLGPLFHHNTFMEMGLASLMVPDIMNIRRKVSPQQRLLIDKIANISLHKVTIQGLATDLPFKVGDFVQALDESGYVRGAQMLNISMPLIQVVQDMGSIMQTTGLNLTTTADLLRDVAQLPSLAEAAARAELAGNTSVQELRTVFLDLARLLESSSGRSTTASQLLHDLRMNGTSIIVPRLADLIFIFREVHLAAENHDSSSLFSHLAELSNDFGTMPRSVSAKLNVMLKWILLFVCDIKHVAETFSYCEDAPSREVKPHSEAEESAAWSMRRAIVEDDNAEVVSGLEDASVLLQRVIGTSFRPPFPFERLITWAVVQPAEGPVEIQAAKDKAQKLTWFLTPEVQETLGSIVRGFSNLASKNKSVSGSPSSGEASLESHVPLKRVRPPKPTPPPKQTPEERRREPATRGHMTRLLRMLLTGSLKLPPAVAAPVAAMLVPDMMTLRRKSSHHERLLMDSLLDIPLDDLGQNHTGERLAMAVEALRAGGYHGASDFLEYLGKTSGDLMPLFHGASRAFASGPDGLNVTTIARWLHGVAEIPGVDALRPTYAVLLNTSRLLERGADRSASAAELLAELGMSDATNATMIQLIGDIVFMARDVRLAFNPSGRPAGVDEEAHRKALKRFLHELADIMADTSGTLSSAGGTYTALTTFIHDMADTYDKGVQPIMAKIAKLVENSDMPPSVIEEIGGTVWNGLTYLCNLKDVPDQIEVCKDIPHGNL